MNRKIGLEVQGLSVCRQGKLILDSVSFTVRPETLTAIIGPNGAGKSTLMRALSGDRPDTGAVLINGENLYAQPEYWLQQLGYVPENNILHDHLTLQDALVYIGKLRLPKMTLEQIKARVNSLLIDFGFPPQDDRRQKPIRLLSTGERKRANVCSELIIDPPILMLDEPTSNLDPNAEFDLMHQLANYAHKRGKTILVITHTLNTIDICDDVIFIENSQLTASGKPQQVLEKLEKLAKTQTEEAGTFGRWAQAFEAHKTRTRQAHPVCASSTGSSRNLAPGIVHMPDEVSWFNQLRYLLQRYMRVRLSDKWNLLGTLLAGLSGILFFVLPGNAFVRPFDPSEIGLALNQARQSIYVVALTVTLTGLITSFTEISKEYYIFKHERLKGLSPSAYYMSKWLWLVVAVGILTPVLLVIFIVLVYRQPLPGFPETSIGETVHWGRRLIEFQLVGLLTRKASWLILTTLILACIASVSLGLFISVLAGDGGKGFLYLSFTVVFIVLFSGLVRNPRLEDLIDTLSFASTGKWAYEGFSSSIGVYCWMDSWRFDEFNSTGHILSVWFALITFTIITAFLSVTILQMRDPWYDQRNNFRRLATKQWRQVIVYCSLILLLLSYMFFLRQQSYAYHGLNYWSRQEFGGTGAYEYASIDEIVNPDWLQYWNGKLSQSACGE